MVKRRTNNTMVKRRRTICSFFWPLYCLSFF
jgi:hypothetical protein